MMGVWAYPFLHPLFKYLCISSFSCPPSPFNFTFFVPYQDSTPLVLCLQRSINLNPLSKPLIVIVKPHAIDIFPYTIFQNSQFPINIMQSVRLWFSDSPTLLLSWFWLFLIYRLLSLYPGFCHYLLFLVDQSWLFSCLALDCSIIKGSLNHVSPLKCVIPQWYPHCYHSLRGCCYLSSNQIKAWTRSSEIRLFWA